MPLGRGLYLEYIRRPYTGDLNAYLVFRDGRRGTRVIAGAPQSYTGDESGGLEIDQPVQTSRAAYGPSNSPRTRQAVRLPTGEQTPEAAWEALTEAPKDLRRRGLAEDVMGDNRRANRITRSLMDAAGIPWGRVVGANKLYHLPGFEGEGLKIEPKGRGNSLRPRAVSPGTELTEGLSAPHRSQTEGEGLPLDQRKAAISRSDLLHFASDAKGKEPTAGVPKPMRAPAWDPGRRFQAARIWQRHRDKDQKLREAEQRLHSTADSFEREGHRNAARFLRHFLDPKADIDEDRDINLSREEARSFKPIRDAEQVNIRRFETDSFLGRNAETAVLLNIQDGQTIKDIEDNWKRDYEDFSVMRHYLFGERDFALSFGEAGLRSETTFTAKRTGNIIELEGRVDHLWDDTFDFHDDLLAKLFSELKDAYELQESGRAAPFKIKSEWCQRFHGTVERREIVEMKRYGPPKRHVKLFNPRIVWEEMEACGKNQ